MDSESYLRQRPTKLVAIDICVTASQLERVLALSQKTGFAAEELISMALQYAMEYIEKKTKQGTSGQ